MTSWWHWCGSGSSKVFVMTDKDECPNKCGATRENQKGKDNGNNKVRHKETHAGR